MASRNSDKTPPPLSSGNIDDHWCKMIRVWTKFVDLPTEKQGAAMFLLLNGEALDAALELAEEVISSRIKSIMAHLDKLYKKVILYLSLMP